MIYIELKFNNGDLTLPLFKYLKYNLLKYHKNKIQIPDFNMETDLEKIKNATVASTFVDMGNLKDDARDYYKTEVLPSGEHRYYLEKDVLKDILINSNVIENDDYVRNMEEKKYFCVFKSHIVDKTLVEKKIVKFKGLFIKKK